MKTHLCKRLKASERRGNGLLSWENMNSSHKARHGVSCELMLSLMDLLAVAVAQCRSWTRHTSLAQTSAQTKVIIKNCYCGPTGPTKGSPTFPPTPSHGPSEETRDAGGPNPCSLPTSASCPSNREQEWGALAAFLLQCLPPPLCCNCQSTSITLPSGGEGSIKPQWVLWGRWLRLGSEPSCTSAPASLQDQDVLMDQGEAGGQEADALWLPIPPPILKNLQSTNIFTFIQAFKSFLNLLVRPSMPHFISVQHSISTNSVYLPFKLIAVTILLIILISFFSSLDNNHSLKPSGCKSSFLAFSCWIWQTGLPLKKLWMIDLATFVDKSNLIRNSVCSTIREACGSQKCFLICKIKLHIVYSIQNVLPHT